jgi:hypothetical protein
MLERDRRAKELRVTSRRRGGRPRQLDGVDGPVVIDDGAEPRERDRDRELQPRMIGFTRGGRDAHPRPARVALEIEGDRRRDGVEVVAQRNEPGFDGLGTAHEVIDNAERTERDGESDFRGELLATRLDHGPLPERADRRAVDLRVRVFEIALGQPCIAGDRLRVETDAAKPRKQSLHRDGREQGHTPQCRTSTTERRGYACYCPAAPLYREYGRAGVEGVTPASQVGLPWETMVIVAGVRPGELAWMTVVPA